MHIYIYMYYLVHIIILCIWSWLPHWTMWWRILNPQLTRATSRFTCACHLAYSEKPPYTVLLGASRSWRTLDGGAFVQLDKATSKPMILSHFAQTQCSTWLIQEPQGWLQNWIPQGMPGMLVTSDARIFCEAFICIYIHRERLADSKS